MFPGGIQSGNQPGLHRPLYQTCPQPPGALDYSFQPSGPAQKGPMYRHIFAEQPNSYKANGVLPQIPGELQKYVQMLEQELALASRKNQEYEATILQLANLLCQAPLGRNHDQGISHVFTRPQYPDPASRFQPQFAYALGAQGNNGMLPPPNYSRHACNELRLSGNADIGMSLDHGWDSGRRAEKNAQHSSHPNSDMARPPPPRPKRPSHSNSTSMRSRSKMPGRPLDFNAAGVISVSSQPNSVVAIPPSSRAKPRFKSSDFSVEYKTGVDRTVEVSLVRTITHEQGAFRIKFSPNGQLLAVLARVGQVVTIYHVATGSRICQLEDLYERDNPPSTQDLSFNSNGEYLATCSEEPENIIKIWDVGKKSVRNVLKGHLNGILCLDFSPNGRLLISGSSDRTIRLWNMRDGSSRILHYSSSYICSIRFSPDGSQFAAGSFNSDVFLWDLRSRHLMAAMTGHTDTVSSIVFMPNGEGLISGSWDGTLKYWNNGASDQKGATAKRKVMFVGNTAEILSVTIPPHGQWIASSSSDCTVGIWDTRTGAQQCTLQSHAWKVYSVDCSPTGDYFASADWKGTVRIWSCKNLLHECVERSGLQSEKQC